MKNRIRVRMDIPGKKIKWKSLLVRSFKIAVMAAVAIVIAEEAGLQNSATAGIIAVLTIQNTKRETFRNARNRGLAFLVALVLAAVCFEVLGYTIWAFAVYLLLFALFCLVIGWREALAPDSVLITHFLAAGNMGQEILENEIWLFLIGTVLGVLVNLHMHRKEDEYERLAAVVDEEIKGILKRMSLWLPREDKSEYGDGCFVRLSEALEEAKLCAVSNCNNTLWGQSTWELDYIRMREQQSVLLREIYVNIKKISCMPSLSEAKMPVHSLPVQAQQIALLLGKIEQEYHKKNTVEGLLEDWQMLLQDMEHQELPRTREEFESRAILFYILMQVKTLLMIKREFVLRQKKDELLAETEEDKEG